MNDTYLDPKKTTGVLPYADENIESVGSCCLDVNGRPAYLVRRRGGLVWWNVFMMFFMPVLFTVIEMLGYHLGNKRFVVADLRSSISTILSLTLLSNVFLWLSLTLFLRFWRTHIPLRFNRATRKVYLHHWGKTFVSDWDNIRAYLYIKLSTAGSGVMIREPQVNIEFQRENGTTFDVYLVAAGRGSHYNDAAAFWEYIRIYMEEGPEKLPALKETWRDKDLREYLKRYNNPFNPLSMNETRLANAIIALLLSPVALPFMALSYPTDYLFYRLAKGIKVNPFPPELADPCLCNESKFQHEQRLSQIRTQIETNTRQIQTIEHTLRDIYTAWFVEHRFPGHEQMKISDGVPEGWSWGILADLVELNPANDMEMNQVRWYLPASAIPEHGMIIDRSKLERRTTPTSVAFRNGDTVFPKSPAWFENGQAGFVDFLIGDEVASGAEELMVMRAKYYVSPEFTFCLATNRQLRNYARSNVESAGMTLFEHSMLANFPLLIPPLTLLGKFDNQYAKPLFKEIASLVAETEKLKQTEDVVSSLPSFEGPIRLKRAGDEDFLQTQDMSERVAAQNGSDVTVKTRSKRKKRKK